MGVLTEKPIWESPIYLIERTDPVMGGEYGISNVQAKQLANRTQYLLALFQLEHRADGSHALTEKAIAKNAAIAESKLDLSVATSDLYRRIKACEEILAEMNRSLDGVEGLDGTPLKSLYEALMLSWEYGYPRFAFEMFTKNFTLRDIFEDVPLLETIAGDDSIDVEDSGTLTAGEAYVLWDKARNESRIVTVKTILTNHRVILWEVEDRTRFGSGYLSKSSWLLDTGRAFAPAGSYYLSGFCDLLEGFERGQLLISHKEDVTFTVSYRTPASSKPTDWQPAALAERWYSEKYQSWRSVFEIAGGTLAFRIQAEGATDVDHVVVMTDSTGALPSTVRTPKIISSDFQVQRFGALYGATHVRTQIEFSPDTNFATGLMEHVELPASHDPDPVWDLKDAVLAARPMVEGESLYWRVRYEASDGYWSLWSGIEQYTHTQQS